MPKMILGAHAGIKGVKFPLVAKTYQKNNLFAY